MKWPETLTLVRHAESQYNELKETKVANKAYQAFLREYAADPASPLAKELAELARNDINLKVGDHNTPLSSKAREMAVKTGEGLKDLIDLPDIIFVSPYERTIHTLNLISEGWLALKGIKTYEEERIREQEHGMELRCNDWKIFSCLYPDQAQLQELQGKYYYRHLQGENVPDVRLRTHSWFDTLIREFSGLRVLAVTHHLTILSTRANLERWDSEQFIHCDEIEKPINCGVTIYKSNPEAGKDGKLELKVYNRKLY